MEKESTIVAIEFGSSKISAIAGRMNEGTMQIIAYAEDHTAGCIKRGVVYNIEKTTQSIKNVIGRLETILKQKVTHVYVGVGGQSVTSTIKTLRSNMQIPTCITQTHIDAITEESHVVNKENYELISFFPQEYVVDSSMVADPVGIVGTNLEGKFLNVIANRKLRNNIVTCFDNTDIAIAGFALIPFELAKNVLTDTEKRSGCALIDLGAGVTTITIFKNNVVRLITTIPLGINNIIHDLCSLQIEEHEAEDLLLKYGDGVPEESYAEDDEELQDYVTSDGRTIKVAEIQYIIESRYNEILSNARAQIAKSEFGNSLLGGIVITGGGACIKNVERAVFLAVNIDKVRIAHSIVTPIIKNSTLTNLSLDNTMSNTILSLVLAGTKDCLGGNIGEPDFFVRQQTSEEIESRKAVAATIQHDDDEAYDTLEGIKNKLREVIVQIQNQRQAILDDEANKRLRDEGMSLVNEASSIIDEGYDTATRHLIGKDKYKQTLREAEDLIAKRDDEVRSLEDVIRMVAKRNGFFTRVATWIDDLVNEK